MGLAFDRQRWMVTAGPTYEPLDPIRFIGNFSSGKMGYALAEALHQAGATVVLISGPTCLPDPIGLIVERITTAEEMLSRCQHHFPHVDGVIMAAAVADFRPREFSIHKIKKQPGSQRMLIELSPNPDILQMLSDMRCPHQRIIGFSLETDHGPTYAMEKLRRKGLDAIVLNHPSRGGGIGADDNEVTIFDRRGTPYYFSRRPKPLLAQAIVEWIKTHLVSSG